MLTFEMKWCLYRGIACDVLRGMGFNKTDVWDFVSDLDMSFEEHMNSPVSAWAALIRADAIDYRSREGKFYFNRTNS